MWTKAQIAAFQRALAAGQKWEQSIERLAEVAKHAPQFAERIAELQVRAQNVLNLAQAALAASTTPVDK